MSIIDETAHDIEKEKGINAYLNGVKEKDIITNIDQYSEAFLEGFFTMQRLTWKRQNKHVKDIETIEMYEQALGITPSYNDDFTGGPKL